jgi:hypothetical protein
MRRSERLMTTYMGILGIPLSIYVGNAVYGRQACQFQFEPQRLAVAPIAVITDLEL